MVDELTIMCTYVVGVHMKEKRKVWKDTHVCDFARAATMQCHRLDGLTQESIISLFWRIEVQDQGVSSVGFF